METMRAMGDAPLNGGVPFGKIEDNATQCNGLPEDQSPKVKHSLEMAGENLGLECGGLGDSI